MYIIDACMIACCCCTAAADDVDLSSSAYSLAVLSLLRPPLILPYVHLSPITEICTNVCTSSTVVLLLLLLLVSHEQMAVGTAITTAPSSGPKKGNGKGTR